jgi:glycosyltransferase involved in cell wall biosynthesis
MNDISVSVICNTFNQVDYIKDALDGFVGQKTNFKFEVLIHDDASTDGTQDIIKQYEKQYPDIIKPIYETENQYSRGVKISLELQYPRVKGKYIAFCEGDDYWNDCYKLQKQFDSLENHPDIDMCSHKSVVVDAETKKIIKTTAPLEKDGVIPCSAIINSRGERVVDSASLFFRRELIDNIPEFRKILTLDYTLKIQGALKGGIYYLSDCMAAYRWLSKGSWTKSNDSHALFWHKLNQQRISALKSLDKETKNEFHEAISREIICIEANEIYSYGDCRLLLNNRYKDEVKMHDLFWKLKVFAKILIPSINRKKNNSILSSQK